MQGIEQNQRIRKIGNVAHLLESPPGSNGNGNGEKCQIGGTIVPFKKGVPGVPGVEMPGITELIRLLKEKIEIEQYNTALLEDIRNYFIKKSPTGKYFSTGQLTISTATPLEIAPDITAATPTAVGFYDRVRVHEIVNRNVPELYVINDGIIPADPTAIIYVRSSSDGTVFSTETPILVGEKWTFNDVYELRVRSPVSGTKYRATEYDNVVTYVSTVISVPGMGGPVANRGSFATKMVNAPVGGAQLDPGTVIPDGFSIVVRANVDNAGNSRVFVANSLANTNIPGNRNTLAPGDDIRCYVNNANLIYIRGLLGTENVDWFAEL